MSTLRFFTALLRLYALENAVMAAVALLFGRPETLIDDALRFDDLIGTGGADAAFRKQGICGAHKDVGCKAPDATGYVAGRMAHKVQIEHFVSEVHQQALEPDVLIYIAAEVAPAVVEDEHAVAEVFIDVLIGVIVVLHEPALRNAVFERHLLFVRSVHHRVLPPDFGRAVERDDQSAIPYPVDDLLAKSGLTGPVFAHHYRHLSVSVLH